MTAIFVVTCLFAAGSAQAQSSDNTLNGLTVEVSTNGMNFSSVGIHPEFSADQRSYDTVVSTSHTHVRVTPTANHSAARLHVAKGTDNNDLTPLASGTTSAAFTLTSGANQIRIRVTAEDGDTESYFVAVYRGGNLRILPAPPRYVQATAGTAKLTLTWEAPVYWGSFPAGGYEVDWYAGSSPPTDPSDWNRATPYPSPLASSATSYEFTGTYGDHTVADGTTYQLQVRAFSTNPNDNSDHLPSDWVVVAGTPPSGSSQSSDARLRALTASSSTSAQGMYNALTLTPSTFSATTTSYTATVANTITHVKLRPTANHSAATVGVRKGNTGNFASVTSGSESAAISLSVGANAITVRVTAQDSTTKDYTVTITRQAQTQSSDNTLSGLSATSATSETGNYSTLNIGTFASTTTSYTATVANTITHVKLRPTANHSAATVGVRKGNTGNFASVTSGSESAAISLSVGANAITVRVTAQDSTTKDYTVTITRQAAQSSNANLSGLSASSHTQATGTFSALTLTPSTFDSATTAYTATVANARTHAKLTPTAAHAAATITVDGTTVNSGSASQAISLSEGSNAITVRVTAQDSTTKDYTVTITRQTQSSTNQPTGWQTLPALSSDASLNSLEIEEASLDFDPDTYAYTLNVYGEATVTLIPTANHPDAEITVNGDTVESGTSHPVTLEDDGETAIEIEVTAEDGTTTRIYTLTVMSCPGEERKILEMFYESTEGDMWEENEGWNIEDDLDLWHGVETDADGRVMVLSLPDNRLSGELPEALACFGGLMELEELDLSNNPGLEGGLPRELENLEDLSVLDIRCTGITVSGETEEWTMGLGEGFRSGCPDDMVSASGGGGCAVGASQKHVGASALLAAVFMLLAVSRGLRARSYRIAVPCVTVTPRSLRRKCRNTSR